MFGIVEVYDQYCGVFQYFGGIISALEGVQYCGGIPSCTVEGLP